MGFLWANVAGYLFAYHLVLVVLPAARYVPRQQGASAVLLAVDQFLFADVEDKGIECFELGLLSKGSHVGCHESRILQTFAGHLCDFCELGIPSLLVVGELGFLSWVAVVGVAGHVDHALVASGRLSHVEHHGVRFGELTTQASDRGC